MGTRRAGTSERGIKDHFGHLGMSAVSVPNRIVFTRVQVVGRARATAALGVVIERQCRVRRCVASIGLGTRGSEVAWVARAAVQVGVGRIHIIFIISRALATNQAGTVAEHA